MARILLGVTGSVAAIRTPLLYQALRDAGHSVRVVATEPSLHFFDPSELAQPVTDEASANLPPGALFRDADEWPKKRYERDNLVLHIELRRWAEVFVVAPLDANTLAKLALGLSDNCLTCVFRAWDFTRPVVLAPAMNTLMWESPVTRRHLAQILDDRGSGLEPSKWALSEAPDLFAKYAPGIVLVPPQAKRLACGDLGVGAMADVAEIVRRIHQ
jgi:phosphopantothenoylcysteine decarboxylase